MNNEFMPLVLAGIGKLWGRQYKQGNRIYSTDNIAACLGSQSQGNLCGYGCLIVVEENECSKQGIIKALVADRYQAMEL